MSKFFDPHEGSNIIKFPKKYTYDKNKYQSKRKPLSETSAPRIKPLLVGKVKDEILGKKK